MSRRDDVEPYLGDCSDDPIVYRPNLWPPPRKGWIERGVAAFIGWVAAIIFVAMILVWLVVLFSYGSHSFGKVLEWREYLVPKVCRPLAERYGLPDLLTRDEALDAIVKLERWRWWPGVSICLKAVNGSWKLK